MKNKWMTVLIVVVFLAGLSLLLYPTVSNYYNSVHHTKAIQEYSDNIRRLEDEVYEKMMDQAKAYNKQLWDNGGFVVTEEMKAVYPTMLDVTGSGIMAYVEIPSIEVTIPVMHGTSDAVLDKGIGHLDWSSLPVGGENTHSVLSAHRGLPSAELFTNLDYMDVGDIFYIHVLGESLAYYVDLVQVVLPNAYETLKIVEGQDYVTLMTCTPYGVNSHRLLVRGTRMASGDLPAGTGLVVKNEVESVDLMVAIPVVLVAVSVLIFIVMLGFGNKRLKRRKDDAHEEN